MTEQSNASAETFAAYVKDKVRAFFLSFTNRPDAQAVAEVLTRWGLDYGFLRTTNVTDWKSTLQQQRGEAQKRVALDKYDDGAPCIIVNRMQARNAKHVFASALHGAILAWQRDVGAKTENGKERLINVAFTDLAQYIGLTKIAEERPVVKDGVEKTAKIADSNARVWFGMTGALEKIADEFAAEAPEMPYSYAGTEERHVIGTILLPVTYSLANGTKDSGYKRIPSYTASVNKMASGEEKTNKTFDVFKEMLANTAIVPDTKNKGYKLLSRLLAESEQPQAESKPVEPPPSVSQPEPAKVETVAEKLVNAINDAKKKHGKKAA